MKRLICALLLVACKHGAKAPADAPKPRADAVRADAAPMVDAAAKVSPTATKVVAGAHASCAVMSDGTVRCWGGNPAGVLGDATLQDSIAPVTPRVHGAKDLVLGDDTACALLDDGSVACWGQIGIGKTPPTLEPTAATGVHDGRRVFAVGAAACAASAAGPLVCWGDVGPHGYLRRGGDRHRLPTPVQGLDHVVQYVASGALFESGDVAIWGDDGVPVRAGIDGVVEIASRDGVVCGRFDDGTTSCFGPTAPCAPPPPKPAPPPPKKPAKGKAKAKPAPKPPAPPPPPAPKVAVVRTKLPPARQLAFDAGGLCVVTTAGRIQCLGAMDRCTVDPPWPAPVKIEMTSGFCARLAGGAVSCWQSDGKHTVRAIAGVVHATQLSAFREHGCALADGGTWCWDAAGKAAPLRFE